MTRGGTCSLPTEDKNCGLVQICENDMKLVVRSIPKLDTLILIKTMLKKHSFGNPFLKSVSSREHFSSRSSRCLTRADRSISAPESSTMTSYKRFDYRTLILLPSFYKIYKSFAIISDKLSYYQWATILSLTYSDIPKHHLNFLG